MASVGINSPDKKIYEHQIAVVFELIRVTHKLHDTIHWHQLKILNLPSCAVGQSYLAAPGRTQTEPRASDQLPARISYGPACLGPWWQFERCRPPPRTLTIGVQADAVRLHASDTVSGTSLASAPNHANEALVC
jgi:hypothetical protein